jgi:tetratricopeptide (TPR) repeat protein
MGTLAIAYNKQKRFIEGRDACREAIALNPIATGVRNTYAYALVNSGDQADGLREYRKILAQEPDNLSVQINVGDAYIAAGNYKAAIETPPISVLMVLSRPEAS